MTVFTAFSTRLALIVGKGACRTKVFVFLAVPTLEKNKGVRFCGRRTRRTRARYQAPSSFPTTSPSIWPRSVSDVIDFNSSSPRKFVAHSPPTTT